MTEPADLASDHAPGNASEADDRSGLTPRESVARVLDQLNVGRVIYVDDVFELHEREVWVVIGLVDEALSKDRQTWEEAFSGVSFDQGVDEWADAFKQRWKSLDARSKDALMLRLYKAVYKRGAQERQNAVEDLEAIGVLRDLIPDGMDIQPIGPTEWLARETELMTVPSGTRVLCLFDRDLRHAVSFVKESGRPAENAGVDLLSNAIRTYGIDASKDIGPIFGLFSHTFTPENELIEGKKLAIEHDIKLDRFLPLSKKRQHKGEVWLAEGIQMMTLNTFCYHLKQTALDCLEGAFGTAREQIEKMSVYNFDEMVLRSSRAEGAWEADTLFRLFQIYHRDDARLALVAPDVSGAFNHAVVQARGISAQRVETEQPDPKPLWKLRHQELYEGEALLNPFHAPLRMGDIFQVQRDKGGSKAYILLAQPCDLALRADGTRSSTHVTLLPLSDLSRDAVDRVGPLFLETNGLISYFKEGRSSYGQVKFKESISISTDIIDLCCLSTDGSCSIDTIDTPSLPEQFSEAWQSRFYALVNAHVAHFETLSSLREALLAVEDTSIRAALWERAVRAEFGIRTPLRVDVCTDSGFSFNLKRLGHFREPGSSHLLSAYTRFLSRPALPHDFADEKRRAQAA
jgi:hypothetical protein